jgi:hypothetical protein
VGAGNGGEVVRVAGFGEARPPAVLGTGSAWSAAGAAGARHLDRSRARAICAR